MDRRADGNQKRSFPLFLVAQNQSWRGFAWRSDTVKNASAWSCALHNLRISWIVPQNFQDLNEHKWASGHGVDFNTGQREAPKVAVPSACRFLFFSRRHRKKGDSSDFMHACIEKELPQSVQENRKQKRGSRGQRSMQDHRDRRWTPRWQEEWTQSCTVA